MAMRKVVGIRGMNFLTYPKMGSSNVMFGMVKPSKNSKGLNPNGTKKEKRKSKKK